MKKDSLIWLVYMYMLVWRKRYGLQIYNKRLNDFIIKYDTNNIITIKITKFNKNKNLK